VVWSTFLSSEDKFFHKLYCLIGDLRELCQRKGREDAQLFSGDTLGH
jgi:hypothetical protein